MARCCMPTCTMRCGCFLVAPSTVAFSSRDSARKARRSGGVEGGCMVGHPLKQLPDSFVQRIVVRFRDTCNRVRVLLALAGKLPAGLRPASPLNISALDEVRVSEFLSEA